MQFHRLILPALVLVLLASCRERPAKANQPTPPPASAPAGPQPPAAATGASPAAPGSPDIPANAQVANPGPIKAAVMKYYQTEGRFPNDWETLVKQKYLPALPKTASGQPADFRAFMRHHGL
jgi:hypothetical protein